MQHSQHASTSHHLQWNPQPQWNREWNPLPRLLLRAVLQQVPQQLPKRQT